MQALVGRGPPAQYLTQGCLVQRRQKTWPISLTARKAPVAGLLGRLRRELRPHRGECGELYGRILRLHHAGTLYSLKRFGAHHFPLANGPTGRCKVVSMSAVTFSQPRTAESPSVSRKP
ncbi:MAG: hypothetical protein K0R38_3619 [Polyangiaceae bacterium]|nr:hypothetical protein [Polyangiaceae bacterium]